MILAPPSQAFELQGNLPRALTSNPVSLPCIFKGLRRSAPRVTMYFVATGRGGPYRRVQIATEPRVGYLRTIMAGVVGT